MYPLLLLSRFPTCKIGSHECKLETVMFHVDSKKEIPFSFFPAGALPLASQLTEEDEKVTKCITEILADTLSKPSPIPVTSECMKILREDERVLAMLHHQHLLTELEDLAHQENAKHRLGHEDSHDAWEGEGAEREELKKREERPGQQREDAASEKMRERDGEWKEEGQGLKEYQKMEKIEEKVKEVSHTEDNREALEEEAAKEKMEDEGEEDGSKKMKRTSSETWSSREYFGHMKNRGSGGPKIRKVMLRGSRDSMKRSGSDKRSFELEGEEEEDDSSEEKPMSHHYGSRHHHEDWEDEEEEGEKKRRRADLAKRVAETASNEETAQFEEEEKEKGLKISNSKGHLHGGWKPWPEEEEEEGDTRYGHHHRSAGLDLKKRHREDYPKGRHHGHEEDEREEEDSQNEAQELEKLQEIEHDLQKAAEKLRELKRGSPFSPHHGQV
ncbi:coiled-coil domain-containing glutamate-rich protein 2 [Heteronotia binoei]|uniref:coiled-coil domain-containing glutamate-rich protein 2 n=1 Tax=Heteronotia binoei TaxID=13085 RepID=UPI00292EC535|nr:coiled-coil domain-containing glutamate-rich protein 2 [Heteronotia binoei]